VDTCPPVPYGVGALVQSVKPYVYSCLVGPTEWLVWRRGNGTGHTNKVKLRQARG